MPYYWVPTDFTSAVVLLPTLAKIAREAWVPTTELPALSRPTPAEDFRVATRPPAEVRRRVYYVPYRAAEMLDMFSTWLANMSFPPDVEWNYWKGGPSEEYTDQWEALDRLYITPAIEMSRTEGPDWPNPDAP